MVPVAEGLETFNFDEYNRENMIRTVLITSLLLIAMAKTMAQSFEGRLIYKVSFEPGPALIKTGATKEMIIERMKSQGEYYDKVEVSIKGGDYYKYINSSNAKWMIYKASDNKVYRFESDEEYVTISDAGSTQTGMITLPTPDIKEIETTKEIMGMPCKAIKLSWGDRGEEFYYYSPEFAKIDAQLFANHKEEYLSEVLNRTGAYPTEFTKTLNGVITLTMTLIEVKEEAQEPKLFEIPKLKKAKGKEVKMISELTGFTVMKVAKKSK